MADRSVSDQPTVYTTSQLRELSDEDGHQAMVDTLEAAAEGSEMLLPLTDGTRVRYVFNGRDLWHRSDLKAAQVIRKRAQRMVKKHG